MWFDVKAFGAQGDGSTDDAPAIQDAIDAVPPGTGTLGVAPYSRGGIVYIPASNGPYVIGSTLVINKGLVLLGDGPGSMLYLKNSANASMIQVTHGADTWVEIHRLALEGNRFNQSGQKNKYGIQVNASSALARYHDVFSHLYVRNVDGTGFEWSQGAPSRIEWCVFNDNSLYQVHFGPNSVDCHVFNTIVGTDEHEGGTIGFLSEGSQHVWLGGAIARCETGAKITGLRNYLGAGCSIDSNNRNGIWLQSSGSRVDGCVFINNSRSPAQTYEDVLVDGSGGKGKYNVVSGCAIDGGSLGQPQTNQATYGVREVNGASGTQVRGNVIWNHVTSDTLLSPTSGTLSGFNDLRSGGNNLNTFSGAAGSTLTIDPSLASVQRVSVANGNNFNLAVKANQSGVPGQMLILVIINNSGGVMGAMTCIAPLFSGGGMPSPANGKSRTVTFVNVDGSNWVETSRTAVDV
jgi:hypothetical protein